MSQVKLILSEDVPKLGHAGDVVVVKPGYARNFLIPQGLAIHATEGRIQELEHHQRLIEERVHKERGDKERERDRIQGVTLEVSTQVGEEGKLFGSVTVVQIAELLAEKGIEVDRRRIELDHPIKETGEHRVPIRLHRDVTAEIKLVVTAANQPPPAPGLDLQDEDELAGGHDEDGEGGREDESSADAEEPTTEE
jgi:large subunit ribosomal protein L9